MSSFITLENQELSVSLSLRGSELTRIHSKRAKQEILYDGKGEWGHSDHVFFPIIGDNRDFTIAGKRHFISEKHGIARSSDFEILEKNPQKAVLSLIHRTNEEYPFDCQIKVTTSLEGGKIIREGEIISLSKREMPFQYGLHPAFSCSFPQAFLEIAPESLLLELENGVIQRRMPWPHPDLWPIERKFIEERDTLVLTNPKGKIALRDGRGNTISLSSNCPYFAIWTPEKASDNDFICLESWYGLSPYVGMPAELSEREAIQKTDGLIRYRDILTIE